MSEEDLTAGSGTSDATGTPSGAPTDDLQAMADDPLSGIPGLQVLKGLEAVRKRPGMYVGSTGARGLHELVWEVLGNAVNQALMGHGNRITLTLLAEGGVRVEDNGEGLWTGNDTEQDLPLARTMTELHAQGNTHGYHVSGGLSGLCLPIVNALSTRMVVDVRNRGNLWHQSFHEGIPDADVEYVRPLESGEGSGTTITFWPSPEVFQSEELSLEKITSRARWYESLSDRGLEIEVRDARSQDVGFVDALEGDAIEARSEGQHQPRPDVDRQTTYIVSRLLSQGIPEAAIDAGQLNSLIQDGAARLSDGPNHPHMDLTYRGAIEVLIERLTLAFVQRGEPLDPLGPGLTGTDNEAARLDLRHAICPLWPFC